MVVPPLLLLFFSKKTSLQQRVRRFFKTPHTPEITITLGRTISHRLVQDFGSPV
jgi:hypothetical protein